MAGGCTIFNRFKMLTCSAVSSVRCKKAIGMDIYYPVPLHLQECYMDLGYKKGDLPVAEEAADSVLSLPVYPELTAQQKDYVVGTIAEFY